MQKSNRHSESEIDSLIKIRAFLTIELFITFPLTILSAKFYDIFFAHSPTNTRIAMLSTAIILSLLLYKRSSKEEYQTFNKQLYFTLTEKEKENNKYHAILTAIAVTLFVFIIIWV